MKEKVLTIPELILLASTRVMLGAGAGLIVAGKLEESKRKGAGWVLFSVGVLTTIPLLLNVLSKDRFGQSRRRHVIEEHASG